MPEQSPPHATAEGVTDDGLMSRARSGFGWVALVVLAGKALSLLTTLVLTRVLTPSDFGLLASAAVVVQAIGVFSDLGLGSAIIHSRAPRDVLGSTAFVIMPAIGLVVYAAAFLSAPGLASLLGVPGAIGLVRLTSVTIVLASLAVVPSMMLEKDLRYRRKVLPELAPSVVYTVVAIVLAVGTDLGPYAVAWALVASAATSLVLNWVVAGFRPGRVFDGVVARQLLRYGRGVLGGAVVAYLTTNMDNVFVSRTAGASALGFYTVAYLAANLPATHAADILGRVLFPSFVQLLDEPARLKSAYERALRVLVVVTFPLLTGLAALAAPLVHTFLGPRWVPMIPLLPVLAVFTAWRCLAGATGAVFLATGNTRYIFSNGASGLVGQAVALGVLLGVFDTGALGAAVAVSIVATLNAGYVAVCAHRIMPFDLSTALRNLGRLSAPATVMGLVMWGVALSLPSLPALVVGVLLGAGLYPFLLRWLAGPEVITELRTIVKRRSAAPVPVPAGGV